MTKLNPNCDICTERRTTNHVKDKKAIGQFSILMIFGGKYVGVHTK